MTDKGLGVVLNTTSTQKSADWYVFAGKTLVFPNAYRPLPLPAPFAGACKGALSTPERAK
jgi:hypothetical protein